VKRRRSGRGIWEGERGWVYSFLGVRVEGSPYLLGGFCVQSSSGL
jgi:hypothetical protein